MLELKDTQIKKTLPESIKYDEKVNDICDSIQAKFDGFFQDTLLVLLLPHLDELSEELIDELAWQYHVDFYRDNYPIENKRKLVRTAIERHRRKGTAGAVEEIVSTVYQWTIVEEWYQWGGDPYLFRLLLRAQDPMPPLSINEVIQLVNEYKSLRSHLEGIYYHIPHDIVIRTSFNWVCYRSRACGTYPYRRRYGSIESHDIVVDTVKGGVLYSNPFTGELVAGVFPNTATQGNITDEALVVDTEKGGMAYRNPFPGEIEAGTFPERTAQGAAYNGDVVVATENTAAAYKHTEAGTIPEMSMSGSVNGGGITANTAAGDIPYSPRLCGSTPGSLF